MLPTFFYDADRNELVVRYDFSANGKIAIDNRIPGLRISLYANLNAVDADCVIKSSADLTISGIGMVPVELGGSGVPCGVCLTDGACLTLEDANLSIIGEQEALSGSGSLLLRRSELRARGGKALTGFSEFTLEDCGVKSPANYLLIDGTVMESEEVPAAYVETELTLTQYAIFVDGKPVFDKTKDDILGDGGSVRYNPKKKLLTLNDPDFSGRAGWILYSDIDGLTINGSAVCSGCHENAAWFLAKTKIDGDFKVYNYTNEDDLGAGILCTDALEFAGGNSYFSGQQAGVYSLGTVCFSGGRVSLNAVRAAIISTGEIVFTNFMQVDQASVPLGCNLYSEVVEGQTYWFLINDYNDFLDYVTIVEGSPFLDIATDAYYYNAVVWAVSHKPYQVTAGIDKTHFGPDRTVTRAQAMVFFWAAKDRPKFKKASTQFVDVKKSDWYYKAVMWAVEKGITAGTDATHFSPNKTCNRGEILTFLYAAMNKPKVKIKSPYKDVTNQWYKKAALWAYSKGIEKGEKGKFNASTRCTRASTVTYLYRFMTGCGLAE